MRRRDERVSCSKMTYCASSETRRAWDIVKDLPGGNAPVADSDERSRLQAEKTNKLDRVLDTAVCPHQIPGSVSSPIQQPFDDFQPEAGVFIVRRLQTRREPIIDDHHDVKAVVLGSEKLAGSLREGSKRREIRFSCARQEDETSQQAVPPPSVKEQVTDLDYRRVTACEVQRPNNAADGTDGIPSTRFVQRRVGSFVEGVITGIFPGVVFAPSPEQRMLPHLASSPPVGGFVMPLRSVSVPSLDEPAHYRRHSDQLTTFTRHKPEKTYFGRFSLIVASRAEQEAFTGPLRDIYPGGTIACPSRRNDESHWNYVMMRNESFPSHSAEYSGTSA